MKCSYPGPSWARWRTSWRSTRPSGSVAPERDRDHRQSIAQGDRPELRGRPPSLAADQDRVISRGAIVRGHRRPPPEQVDLDQMGAAPQQLPTLRQVLLAILAGPSVGRAQKLDDRDQLAAPAVADLQVGDPLDLLRRQPDLRRVLQDEEAIRGGGGGGGGGGGKKKKRERVDGIVIPELHDVIRRDLGGQLPPQAQVRNSVVEVRPVVRLLEVGIHPRER